MKTYEYILFDWDGCLAMTLDIWIESFKEVFAEYKLYPSDQEITTIAFLNWEGPRQLGITDTELFKTKMKQRVSEKSNGVLLYDGVVETLKKLKAKNKKLALLTTSLEDLISPALEQYELRLYFDTILTAESVTMHKPDPQVIELAITHLKGNKESAIMIGDSVSDLGAAKNAGIDSILFYPKHNERFYTMDALNAYSPTYIVTAFTKILDIV
jgi:HAD superfamily hydrolase (TIGR01509 family)